jgi:uncharacterized protein with FMN-binding domain
MRRIIIVILSTVTAVTLLFSYHTSTDSGAGQTSAQVRQRPSTASRGATFTGEVAETQWGPVQVRITVQGGKITAAEAVQYPRASARDAEINGRALPLLNEGAVQAQSAAVDTVSGATVTSDGYLASLQSAIDQSHQ